MHRLIYFLLISLFFLAACRPQTSAAQVEILPSLVPSPTAAIDIESAERSARLYMTAWQELDYAEMYRLLSFNSQEAIPEETFINLYEDVADSMTLQSLDYTAHTLQREADQVVVFRYDITFTTLILGEFSDTERDMHLVYDSFVNDWRVAWSRADIFAEMGDGARLAFEPRIPSRANIYDRNGVVLADQNGVAVRVSLIPEDMPQPETCMIALSQALNKSIEAIQEQINNSGSNWLVEMGAMEPNTYAQFRDTLTRDCGATFNQLATRRYLRGSLMPHVLGNVGYPDEDEIPGLIDLGFNQDVIIGKSGIERSWDETLRGTPGGRLSLISRSGGRLRVLAETPSVPSQSVWLTIDSTLQEYILRTLGEAYIENAETWGTTSRGASALVLSPKTGEILAMVSYPSFDGNATNPFPAIGREVADSVLEDLAENEGTPQLNRVTQGAYPAGSVMKVIGATAIADSGIYTLDRPFMCTGVWQQGNDQRFDWLAGGHGRVTIQSALAQSCNPFFYEVGYQLNQVDPYLLPSYARRMGLGSPTGLTDLVENPGQVIDPEWVRVNQGLPWSFSYAVSMSIGQGELEVTPLQMGRMYAGIANGGYLMRPQMVLETGILNQRTQILEPEIMDEWDFNPEVMSTVYAGLCDVTTQLYGTATHIFRQSPLQNIGVCAKTGTAQAGGQDQQPHSWFIAFAPADDPEILTVVMVENSGDGSAIAAPLTRRIMEYYFFGPFD